MNALRHAPLGLVLLGTLLLAGAVLLLARALVDPAAAPSTLGDLVLGLLVAALSGATFGGALLATRLRAAADPPRAVLAIAFVGALLGGFAAFATMAAGAESDNLGFATAMLLLVLVALGGVGAGARTWRVLG